MKPKTLTLRSTTTAAEPTTKLLRQRQQYLLAHPTDQLGFTHYCGLLLAAGAFLTHHNAATISTPIPNLNGRRALDPGLRVRISIQRKFDRAGELHVVSWSKAERQREAAAVLLWQQQQQTDRQEQGQEAGGRHHQIKSSSHQKKEEGSEGESVRERGGGGERGEGEIINFRARRESERARS